MCCSVCCISCGMCSYVKICERVCDCFINRVCDSLICVFVLAPCMISSSVKLYGRVRDSLIQLYGEFVTH